MMIPDAIRPFLQKLRRLRSCSMQRFYAESEYDIIFFHLPSTVRWLLAHDNESDKIRRDRIYTEIFVSLRRSLEKVFHNFFHWFHRRGTIDQILSRYKVWIAVTSCSCLA